MYYIAYLYFVELLQLTCFQQHFLSHDEIVFANYCFFLFAQLYSFSNVNNYNQLLSVSILFLHAIAMCNGVKVVLT